MERNDGVWTHLARPLPQLIKHILVEVLLKYPTEQPSLTPCFITLNILIFFSPAAQKIYQSVQIVIRFGIFCTQFKRMPFTRTQIDNGMPTNEMLPVWGRRRGRSWARWLYWRFCRCGCRSEALDPVGSLCFRRCSSPFPETKNRLLSLLLLEINKKKKLYTVTAIWRRNNVCFFGTRCLVLQISDCTIRIWKTSEYRARFLLASSFKPNRKPQEMEKLHQLVPKTVFLPMAPKESQPQINLHVKLTDCTAETNTFTARSPK